MTIGRQMLTIVVSISIIVIVVTSESGPTTLPEDCYDPPGRNCSFYRNCLEVAIPCGESSSAYAIPYGEKFCNLFAINYKKFSENGKIWIDAVRKCLQLKLVPYLSQHPPPSCSDIKTIAFHSHSGCYSAPATGISVCTIMDQVPHIIDTVKSSLLTNPGSTFWQSLQVTHMCGGIDIRKAKHSILSDVHVIKSFGVNNSLSECPL